MPPKRETSISSPSSTVQTSPSVPARGAVERPVSRRDLLILRALVSYPWATDNEVGRALSLPRATVTRARLRLRERGICRPRYTIDLDNLSPQPTIVLCGRGGADASDKDLARGLERLLKEHRLSGAALVEGGAFSGAVFRGAVDRLPLWIAAALRMRAPRADTYLFASLDAYPFPRAEGVLRSAVDFEPFMEQLTGNTRLADVLSKPVRPKAAPTRPLRQTELEVARSLLRQPGLPIGEASKNSGLSRSTFAHVKGALLARGFLKQDVWINAALLGFPLVLIVAHYHRPRDSPASAGAVLDILSQGTAPVTHFASATHEFTVTPFRDLVAVRSVLQELQAREREFELLSPAFASVFMLPQATLVSHSDPDDLTAAWLNPAE